MNSIRTALGITAIASLMTLTARAEEKGPGAAPKLIRLQSDGETFAEVRLFKAPKVNLSGKNVERDITTGATTAIDATVEIEVPGGKSFTLKADQIEVIYDDVGATRVAEMRERNQKLPLLRQNLNHALTMYTEEHPVVKGLREQISNLESKR